jgi:hypothetical protein
MHASKDFFILALDDGDPVWEVQLRVFLQLFDSQSPVALMVVPGGVRHMGCMSERLLEKIREIKSECYNENPAEVMIFNDIETGFKQLDKCHRHHHLPLTSDVLLGDSVFASVFFIAAEASGVRGNTKKIDDRSASIVSILDYSVQPYSIGDFLTFLYGTIMAAGSERAVTVDLIVLSDLSLGHADPSMRALLASGGHSERLMSILQLCALHPSLRSLKVFYSWRDLNRYLGDIHSKCYFWPSIADLRQRKYLTYDIFISAKEFYDLHGNLPRLFFPGTLSDWADAFFLDKGRGSVSISVNLRNNKNFGVHRNVALDAWHGFFRRCENKYPVKFFIVGDKEEVDIGSSELKNVICAKSFGTNLLQDLSLINRAAFHLGSCSGPALLAMFLEKPYYIFNNDMLPHLARWRGSLVLHLGEHLRCSWAAPYQSLGLVKETEQLISEQFVAIWESRDWMASQVS